MDTTGPNHTNLAWILALLIGLGVAGGMYWKNNQTLTRRYDQAEQRADSLLSVKFLLEGDNRELKRQLETVADDNTYLDRRIKTLHGQLAKSDGVVAGLYRKKTAQSYTIRNLADSLAELQVIRDSLEHQLMAMRDKINWQSQSNTLLAKEKKELEQKQKDLNTRILTMVPRSAMTGDAFRVDVSKSNKKVTAKAKKATTLTISLNVPTSLNLEGKQELYMSLTDQQRQPMTPALRNTTIILPDMNEVIPVHAEQTVNFSRSPQRISFRFTSDAVVKPGTYRASVFTKDAYLGSVEFQLRDSFWFF
ncbi:hypothetical protein GCM10028805_00390 [Spirosoma harenae]